MKTVMCASLVALLSTSAAQASDWVVKEVKGEDEKTLSFNAETAVDKSKTITLVCSKTQTFVRLIHIVENEPDGGNADQDLQMLVSNDLGMEKKASAKRVGEGKALVAVVTAEEDVAELAKIMSSARNGFSVSYTSAGMTSDTMRFSASGSTNAISQFRESCSKI